MNNVKVPEEFIRDIITPACGGDTRVVDAFRRTPRSKFIDEAMCRRPYVDDALPIGYGQTISKPSTVAFMTQALDVTSEHKVLEIGSGSGFQAAILSRLAKTVYTVERIPELYRRAMTIIRRMSITNVRFKIDDGNLGWDENAPYHRIIATAEARNLPSELTAQLADGGKMLIPLNGNIVLVTKEGDSIKKENIAPCSFVDFVCE